MLARKVSGHLKPNSVTELTQRLVKARRFRWILSSGLLLSLLLSALPLAGAQQEAGAKTKKWPVKGLVAGSPQTRGTLEISQSTIALKLEKGPDQEIPISKVAEVTYDNSSHSKSRGWLHAAEATAGTPFIIGVYPVAAPLVGAAFAAPFKTRAHFVRILWNDAEYGPAEVLLEIGKQDYAGVLAELQSLTGKPWRNRPEERKKRLQDIQSGKVAKQSFTLEQLVLVNDAELKPGPYVIVVLERPQDAGEVYFYRGADLNPDHIVTQAVVKIEKRSGTQAGVTPIFAAASDAQSLAALEMPDETLRFTARAVPSAVERAARSFYAGSGHWAMVMRTTYKGETAFRFFVEAPCTTFVYVTRERFSFEGKCKEFEVARGEVKATTLSGKSNRYLQVTVKDKSWTFRPFFEFPTSQNPNPISIEQLRAPTSYIGSTHTSATGQSGIAAREFSKFFVRTVTDFDAVERETAANSPLDLQMPVHEPPQLLAVVFLHVDKLE